MTVAELIAELEEVDKNLVVIVETIGEEHGQKVDIDQLASHIEYNDTELYICADANLSIKNSEL